MLMLKMLLFAALCVGSQGLKKLGAGTGPGQALDAMVDMASLGDYVYGAELGGNLKIVDVADKANPVELGEIPRGARGKARGVLVSGDLLYVAWRHAMVVYTLQNPAVPAALNTFAPQDADRGNDRGIAESAHHIYVAYMNKMTRLESFYVLTKGSLNLVGMYTPTLTTETDSLETMDMVHHDGKVYATRASVSHWRISTFLVSDPANPSLHAMEAIPDFGFGRIVYHEGSLYVSQVSDQLWKADAASLSQQPLNAPTEATNCQDMHFRGSRLYLACRGTGGDGVFVLEETATTGTFTLLAKDEDAMVLALLVEGDHLFLSGLGKTLQVYEISSGGCTPMELVFVGKTGPGALDAMMDLTSFGDYVYGTELGGKVRVVDVADKANPVELGEIPKGAHGNARAVLVSGDLLYVAWRHAMVVYTLQNPAVPAVLNTFAPQDANRRNDRGIAESAHHIYVAYMNEMTRLESFYVLTKGSLNLVGMYTPALTTETDSLETMDMVHHDGKVYAAKASTSHWRISTFLVSDPANPSLHAMKAIPDFGFGRIVYHEGSLYVSQVSDQLWKADAASLSQQPLNAPTEATNCQDMHFRGSRLYLACRGTGGDGVFVLEETATTGTFTLLAKDEVAMVLALLVEGDHLFLSGLGKSLEIYDISAKCPSAAAPMVELVGGPALVTVKVPPAADQDPVVMAMTLPLAAAGGQQGSSSVVKDDVSGQMWTGIPSWLAGSTAHMGAHGRKGMSLKVTCPANQASDPCTFYVVLHNCPPCSSTRNGGLPQGLLNAGFEAGSCGPKYVPTFPGAPSDRKPLPTAIFKLEVAAGAPPVEVPITKDLLHFVVFVVTAGEQCSLKQDEAACGASSQCHYDASKGCLDRPMCKKPSGPNNGGTGVPKTCTCFAPPSGAR